MTPPSAAGTSSSHSTASTSSASIGSPRGNPATPPVSATWSDSAGMSNPPWLITAPVTSLTATTRMPADCEEVGERAADLAEALDHDPASREVDVEGLEHRPGADHDPGRGTAGVGPGAADRERLAGHRARQVDAAAGHLQRVEQPRHDPAVGVDVGGRDVAVGTEQRRDLGGVAPGQPLELADAESRAGRSARRPWRRRRAGRRPRS